MFTKDTSSFLQVSNSNIAKNGKKLESIEMSDASSDIVKVLKNNNIIDVPLNEFIVGSLAGEISPTAPKEALKAQATAIYTLVLYRKNNKGYAKSHNGADICADPSHCLLFLNKDEIYNKWGRNGYNENYDTLMEIVQSCKYDAICYEGVPINSIFFAISSGNTKSCFNAFGEDLPYLQSVESKEDISTDGYESILKISKKEAHEKLKKLSPDLNLDNIDNAFATLEIVDGMEVLNVDINGIKIPGTKIRTEFLLRSSAFSVKSDKKNYIFSVKGYGHNVGMSQAGAIKMAETGKKSDEILSHYYIGTNIMNVPINID